LAHDSQHNIKRAHFVNFAGYLPLSTTLVGLAKVYANDPWSVTEPGVPGWHTGAKA